MSRRETKKELYRTQMIDASREAISEVGLARLNVRQISEKAGVSFGNLHYHFGGKDGLLLEVLKNLLSEIREIVRRQVPDTDDPMENLLAYVAAQFDPSVYTTANCVAWLNFWNEAATQAQFARLEEINRRRVQSNLRYHLSKLVDRDIAIDGASDIQAMIDGLWLRKAHLKEAQTSKQARETVRRFVGNLLS